MRGHIKSWTEKTPIGSLNKKLVLMDSTERRVRFKKMYKLYLSGASYAEIGKKFKISRERVRQIFKSCSTPEELLNLQKRTQSRLITVEKVDKISNLVRKGLSCKSISDELGYSIDLVKRVSSKYGLQTLKSVS